MQLKVGGVFKDQRGNLWKISKEDVGYRYPFVAVNAEGSKQTYAANGRWSHHEPSVYDLRE